MFHQRIRRGFQLLDPLQQINERSSIVSLLVVRPYVEVEIWQNGIDLDDLLAFPNCTIRLSSYLHFDAHLILIEIGRFGQKSILPSPETVRESEVSSLSWPT
jgi:hypothetical protein